MNNDGKDFCDCCGNELHESRFCSQCYGREESDANYARGLLLAAIGNLRRLPDAKGLVADIDKYLRGEVKR